MRKILSLLHSAYPDAHCSLTYKTPFQLLIATILSAQCTDDRVNLVTPPLFKKFPTAEAMSLAPESDLQELVRTTGFYQSKARALLETSKLLVQHHEGRVPKNLDALTKLRGVGRKTANVVLGNAYGVPSLVVDTHVGRLSRRMGFTKALDPEKVEAQMMEIVPKEEWVIYSHLLIAHGRAICQARKPQCAICPLSSHCPKLI